MNEMKEGEKKAAAVAATAKKKLKHKTRKK